MTFRGAEMGEEPFLPTPFDRSLMQCFSWCWPQEAKDPGLSDSLLDIGDREVAAVVTEGVFNDDTDVVDIGPEELGATEFSELEALRPDCRVVPFSLTCMPPGSSTPRAITSTGGTDRR
jgi:hypothetical protein